MLPEASVYASSGAPRALHAATCACIRAFSSSTELLNSDPGNQPDTSASPERWRSTPSACAFVGNLIPLSIPLNPASRACARHTSRVMSLPNWESALSNQAIGETPKRTFINSINEQWVEWRESQSTAR